MTQQRYIFLSEGAIFLNWESIVSDPYNNRPDIKSPEEYIAEVKAGRVTAGGYPVKLTEPIEE